MAHETEHTSNHPTFNQYVFIAIVLFAITIVEFGLIWDRIGIADDLGVTKIPILIGLSAIKFAIVIMYYMHLKFDDRFFGTVFIAGLVLAFVVGGALITLFIGFEAKPREYALAHAVPYEGHEAAEEHAAEVVEPGTGAETTVASGPVELAVGVVGETLAFDTANITAKSGSEVTITFKNSSANNQHNLVIVQDGTKDEVATDGTTAGPDNDWVAPGDARVVANTPLLAPGASGEVIFTAPAPGTYQFVCTFPGHNFTMFGDFIVN
jgi:azurin